MTSSLTPEPLGLGAVSVSMWRSSWLPFVLVLACDSTGAKPQAQPSTPQTEATVPPAPEADPPPKAPTASTKLTSFASAGDIQAFLEKRQKSRGRYGGMSSLGYGSGSGAGFGGLGLTGTGMGGGGTGEGTIGLGSSGGILGSLSADAGHFLASPAGESITNTQEAGVDEGGIVKMHGEHLVVLRRGRLFTVAVGDDSLKPISAVDVGPKGTHQAWYDEMLIHGDEVIVIGYSYAYGGTELARFNIGTDGSIKHTVTDVLRSNDYYSSRNYTSRLIGDRLVFYMPHRLGTSWPKDGEASTDAPALCRAKGPTCSEWKGIVKSTNVYKPADDGPADVLHTVITCDLSKGADMACEGRGILGAYSRNFYVSGDAVYIWVNDPTWQPPPPWAKDATSRSDAIVYRLGLRDDSVAALRTYGAPVDQFSFSQTPDGNLNVLVRAAGAGGGMWGSELNPSHDVAMLRTPVSSFKDGAVAHATDGQYIDLPDPKGGGNAFHNRFVGNAVLYGNGAGWGPPSEEGTHSLIVHQLGGESTTLELEHPVDRIEPIGTNAVVVGASDSDLHFAAIDLSSTPKAAGTYVHQGANQGETRSHGFFYRPTSDTAGMLGLPVRRGGASTGSQLSTGSAEVLYLRVDDMKFEQLGTLRADPKANKKDRCKVSCTDWYGNARPLFLGDRVLALLGYEVVEGRQREGGFVEKRRTNMLSAL